MLASAATAFRFKVQCLGRADDFHIDAIGLRPDDRILDRTILTAAQRLFGSVPGSAASGWIRCADGGNGILRIRQPPLHRLAQIAASDRGRGIAERIGAVGQRFVLKTEIFAAVHLVDPERLAAVIDRTASRTIRIGQWITLWQEVALLVQGTECFIADLVIEEHELPEVWS